MHITLEIDSKERIVLLTVSGELTDPGLLQIYDELRDASEVRPDFGLLIDLREAIGRDVSADGVGSLAKRPPLFSPESRRAVVLPSDFGFEMARMYEMRRDATDSEVRVFQDIAEARRWAGTADRYLEH